MSNLSIENLSGLGSADGSKLIGSEARVAREMRNNGMTAPEPAGSGQPVEFMNMLAQSLDTVNTQQLQADTAVKELVAGRSKNIHETMLTIERADTSLKLAMQVRNKILDAYREIMRMQV